MKEKEKILKEIIKEKGIYPVYQPIINLTDNSVYGYEALSRVCKEACIKVIAEGIETEIEAAIIKELGADFVQGYYFARPSERFLGRG